MRWVEYFENIYILLLKLIINGETLECTVKYGRLSKMRASVYKIIEKELGKKLPRLFIKNMALRK